MLIRSEFTRGKTISFLEHDVIKNEEQFPKDVLESLFKDFSITFYMIKPDEHYGYRFIYMAKSVERLLGYSPSHFTDNPEFWFTIIHEEDRPFW